jgi:hypothetical protein
MKILIFPILIAALVAAVPLGVRGSVITPDLSKIADTTRRKVTDATAEAATVDGKKAAHLQATGDSANGSAGMALVNGTEFSTGSVELDLKGNSEGRRSFVGVVFNVLDTKTFEAIYFRPFNFRTNEPYSLRAVQYISWPAHPWERLRKEKPNQFEKPVTTRPDPLAWFHARIEVTHEQVRVFVNHAKEPSLSVDRLAKGGVKRPVGLFVDTHDAFYANLQIEPDANTRQP